MKACFDFPRKLEQFLFASTEYSCLLLRNDYCSYPLKDVPIEQRYAAPPR